VTTKRGKHTSTCPKSGRRLSKLERDDRVTGIKHGAIDNARTKYGAGHLRFQRYVDAGMKVNCYMDGAVLTVYVYCDDRHKLEVRALLDS
jgi:hypothetical protein